METLYRICRRNFTYQSCILPVVTLKIFGLIYLKAEKAPLDKYILPRVKLGQNRLSVSRIASQIFLYSVKILL